MSAPEIPFRKDMKFEYGVAQHVSPLVRRVVANNPSPFTFNGTNTYIVGRGEVAVIDPGPADDRHVECVATAVKGETVTHILVTHTHMDHSPGTAALKSAVGGTVVGAHPKPLDPSARTVESIQRDFTPDVELKDGDAFAGPGWTLTAVFTPGHMSNHHCFALKEENAFFSGDHVMGWNTTIVSPPDGNMREYLASLRRCIAREDRVYHPGHGPAVETPRPFVRAYLTHRMMREEEILRCLRDGADTVPEMVKRMYAHLPAKMHGAAARSVFAHIEHMVDTGRIATDAAVTAEARYRIV
jgi:glyoxylase-like metal-dependent hydrolase (beta-lactamase superfamily II)